MLLIPVFQASRKAWKQGLLAAAATGVLCCAILLWMQGLSPSALWGLAPAVIVAGFARFQALMAAQEAHLRLLSVFYNELEPRRFIEQYEPICRQDLSDNCRRAMLPHLANAYAYAGDFAAAVSLISSLPMPRGKRERSIQLMVAGNLCTYHLLEGDADAARQAHQEMGRLLEQSKEEKRKISINFDRTFRTNQLYLALLAQEPVDVSVLREELETRSNRLHKALCRYLLAWSYAQAGKRAEARGVLKEVLCLEGSVILLDRARELDERLKAED